MLVTNFHIGVSQRLLLEMKKMAKMEGYEYFLTPVRPTGKINYPFHSLKEYCSWLREDGLSIDPWLRTHDRVFKKIRARFYKITVSSTIRYQKFLSKIKMSDF